MIYLVEQTSSFESETLFDELAKKTGQPEEKVYAISVSKNLKQQNSFILFFFPFLTCILACLIKYFCLFYQHGNEI